MSAALEAIEVKKRGGGLSEEAIRSVVANMPARAVSRTHRGYRSESVSRAWTRSRCWAGGVTGPTVTTVIERSAARRRGGTGPAIR